MTITKNTQYISSQYNVSEENLKSFFGEDYEGVESLHLWDISISPSGHGHYKIESKFEINEKELIVNTTTSNMPLIDSWKALMNDSFDTEDKDHYDNEDEVIESMLSALNADDEINEICEIY